MSAIEKWVAGSGVGLTWTSCINTALNVASTGVPSGNSILGETDIVNGGSTLDLFCDVSLVLASLACVSPNYIGVYLYPLSDDGTHYGDGRFTGTSGGAAGLPAANYYVGSIGLVAATQAQYGQLTGIIIPPGTFRFCLYNGAGVATATSGNTFKYRTYNRQVA